MTEVFSNAGRPVIVAMDKAPVDADFDDPMDGIIVFDRAGDLVWFRLNGVWRSVALP